MIVLRVIGIVLVALVASALVALRFKGARDLLFRLAPKSQAPIDRMYPLRSQKGRREQPPTYGQA